MMYLSTLLAESKLKLNIPSDIKKIYKVFRRNGKQLFVVGGAVRDAILGKRPKDFDLATDAKPEEVIAIAKKNGLKVTDEVGKQFGVVLVNGHEIATFRKDIGKGRRPSAVDYTDIQGDVKRRDLTINALFYDMGRGEIVDLVGGIADLKKKKIRTVGNPTERFDEDPLRKLRAVRFAGSVGGRMTPETWAALKKNPDISKVSKERIRDEFIKGIKKSKSVPNYLKMITKLGMFKQIFPGLKINTKFINTNDYIVQLANLLRRNHSSTVSMRLKQSKYTSQEVKDITQLLVMSELKEKTLAQHIYQIKAKQQLTKLKPQQVKQWASIAGRKVLKVWNFKLSVSAQDAMKQGLRGKAIGDYIKKKESELFTSS
jgi:tRNA nucleotidyltransferase/poly(A) polymerase